ncbi:unnamed protein product [Hermetia illucens]|uniref:HOOK N-terminal domain-containing protein n=1 Tax=Hermetia illucens TaxID=343691 RepID=A0A7R8UI13_HERIL|nr:girdin-like [Hermetia illucens]CAD7081004.1 unnamed protein product [Hermetia illucens]
MAACDIASSAEIEDFLHCALVSWLELYLPKSELISGYASLLDGVIINWVWQKVDPDPLHSILPLDNATGPDLATARTKNFEAIVQNIRDFYENELDQVILALPDCFSIGFKPDSKTGLEQLKLLITLILGAAVQSSQKEVFIEKIKELDEATQHEIVEMIKLVIDESNLVLSKDNLCLLQEDALFNSFKAMQDERNFYYFKWISAVTDIEKIGPEITKIASSASSIAASKNCEITELKSTIRELKRELTEKADVILELTAEIDLKIKQAEKLQSEKQELYAEAKRAIAYRDELDAAHERIEQADHLETEVRKLRKKLSNAEFYKARVDQLLEDNRLLKETKDILEDQLERDRQLSEQMSVLELQVNDYKEKLNEIVLERNAEQAKFEELIIENTQLHLSRHSLSAKSDLEVSFCDVSTEHMDISLSDELRNSVQAKLLALELENSRLLNQIEVVKDTSAAESIVAELVDLQKKYKEELGNDKQLDLAIEQNRKLLNALRSHKKTTDQHSEEIRIVTEQRDTLKSYLIRAQKKLKELAEQNKDQAGKINQLNLRLVKLVDSEQKVHDLQEQIEKLASQQVANETQINNMQKELELQTKTNDAIKKNLQKLGFNAPAFESPDIEAFLMSGKVFSTPEVRKKFLKIAGITSSDLPASSFRDNPLIVKVSTLESKLSSLQQVNNQLASNKDRLIKQIEALKHGQPCWVRDQNHWEKRHVRLNVSLTKALKDPETLKKMILDLGDKDVDLKHFLEKLEKANPEELDALKADYAKLTEDFSALFKTCNQYKNDYETLNAEYDTIQTENERLKEQIIELSEKIEDIVYAENDYTSLADRCEMLMTMNANLTRERKVLMENVSKLFTQYRELLSHTLEDKQFYHDARENYLQKVSELKFHKERLEMKIIGQHLTAENATKKKETSLIKRVKKVGSDLLSKVPTRSRKSLTDESSSTPSKLQQNDSESVSPASEPSSGSVQDTYSDLSTQSSVSHGDYIEPAEPEVEDNRRNSNYASPETSGEPINSLDSLRPGYRKPIYVNESKSEK